MRPRYKFTRLRIRGAGKPPVRGPRAWIRLLTVRAPRGALVEVRCKGKGWPFRVSRVRAPRGGTGATTLVRIKRMHGRSLRAGTLLEIRVTAGGRVGKHVAFRFRARQAPVRKDGCCSRAGRAPSPDRRTAGGGRVAAPAQGQRAGATSRPARRGRTAQGPGRPRSRCPRASPCGRSRTTRDRRALPRSRPRARRPDAEGLSALTGRAQSAPTSASWTRPSSRPSCARLGLTDLTQIPERAATSLRRRSGWTPHSGSALLSTRLRPDT